MAFLAYYGHVPPSDYSSEIRRHGMTHAQADRLQGEIVKIRKVEIEFEFTLAKLRAGLPLR